MASEMILKCSNEIFHLTSCCMPFASWACKFDNANGQSAHFDMVEESGYLGKQAISKIQLIAVLIYYN